MKKDGHHISEENQGESEMGDHLPIAANQRRGTGSYQKARLPATAGVVKRRDATH